MGSDLEVAVHSLRPSEFLMRKFGAALLLSIFVLAIQGHAKEPKLSNLLLHARYVALGFETARGFLGEWETESFVSANILPEDRRALANLSDAINKWNRYAVTIDPRQAELLIAVRAGRLASANGGIHIEAGSIDPTTGSRHTPGVGIGPMVGAEAGPPSDYLAVYSADAGREGPRLWRKTENDGLVGQDPPLFESFKSDVEAAAKKSKKP